MVAVVHAGVKETTAADTAVSRVSLLFGMDRRPPVFSEREVGRASKKRAQSSPLVWEAIRAERV